MANPRYDDPAASALPRTLHVEIGLEHVRPREALHAVPPARPARPPGLVKPRVDPPPALREGPELAEFKAKGRHYTEDEKQWFLDKQRELVARVIPLHRELAARGQIELTTTPFYHPILPLLIDKTAAREAMPEVTCRLTEEDTPKTRPCTFGGRREPYPPFRRAAAGHVAERRVGLAGASSRSWPNTGSSGSRPTKRFWGARPAARSAATAGGTFAIPSCSIGPGRCVRATASWRSSFAIIRCPTRLAFTISAAPGRRRRPISWASWRRIGDACRHNPATLVPVILDGENCWEYYPDGGVSFLRSLYQGIAKNPRRSARSRSANSFGSIRRPTACNGCSREAGSAITSQSGSVIPKTTVDGMPCTRPARSWWKPSGPRAMLRRHLATAWNEIYIAEGSDWFWWYGDDHSSALDGLFDHLFRKHLRNVYTLLGSDPPGSLFAPISRRRQKPLHSQPVSFSNVKVDGRATYFEWIDAARYVCGNDRGTMTLVTRGLLESVWFGFDAERLLVRVDTEGGPARERLSGADRLRIGFVDPCDREIIVVEPADRSSGRLPQP